MSDPSALIPDQRRDRLMRALRQDEVLSIAQLTELLGVSHMTVRRDIGVLEREGRAHAVAGGVRLAEVRAHEPPFVDKSQTDRAQKRGIAAVAATLLVTGMTVYLDAGTTTGALVDHVRECARLRVVTNDFAIVAALYDAPHIEVTHTGGRLEHANRSAVGPLAAQTLQAINLDLAFVSASSWDIARGLTTPSESKIAVKRAAIEAAPRSVLLAASSKFATFGMYTVAELARFDHIVTDTGLPDPAAAGIRDLGVTLHLAEPRADPMPARPIRSVGA